MITFKKYLAHRLKETGPMTLVFTLISAILTLSVIIQEADQWAKYDDTYKLYRGETGIYILAIVLGVFATVIPLLETAGFKNRRNLDTLYFLPMSRFKLALAHYVSGFIQVAVIYTFSFVAAGLTLINYAEYFSLVYLPFYYVASLLLGLVIYSFFMFIFDRANTVVDGVIFCVMWMFALWLICGAFFGILEDYLYSFFSVVTEPGIVEVIAPLQGIHNFINNMLDSADWWIVSEPIDSCTVIFQNLMENPGNEYAIEQVENIISQAYMFAVWGIIGIASAYGYFKNFIRHKVESTGEISASGLGYKLLIPLYGYCCLISSGNDISLKIMFFAMMIVGYAIYRRSIKLKKSDIIALAVGLVLVYIPHNPPLSVEWILFFGTPIFAVIWLGIAIYRLYKAVRKRYEAGEKLAKAEMAKRIIGIMLSSLLLILSVFAIVASVVFAVLN